ncbi:hypothetical protein PF007_g29022 [Phytophthora fragariae]|uniref:Uncharacterized protein n=1 Tax=Phytophthora fragariae TaxID=53985 RepID=A0A6A3PY50_9STRA|nr:hypothetical protein PF009_g28077 [Phytophthora fragariae]KAE9064927.1 hypothetical protein PF007_g29022 [Phytophthora fragariae]KAE9259713.1 hypothetical protein PF008_g33293 [Phytophthora fragariae]KAE9274829.1 hypothetical protein PF001_g26885 [Phytophthora fragariae]
MTPPFAPEDAWAVARARCSTAGAAEEVAGFADPVP